FGDIARRARQLRLVGAFGVPDGDAVAKLAMPRDISGIAPPQRDLVPGKGEIGRARKRTVARADNRTAHVVLLPLSQPPAMSLLSPRARRRAGAEFVSGA